MAAWERESLTKSGQLSLKLHQNKGLKHSKKEILNRIFSILKKQKKTKLIQRIYIFLPWEIQSIFMEQFGLLKNPSVH